MAEDAPGTTDKLELARTMGGVTELCRRRGDESVKFRQVADHLVDFAARHPDGVATVDRLAGFLAEVESVEHDHDAPAGSEEG